MAGPKYRSKAWKKKNASKGPINPWYQNPDGSAKSEKTQKQQYVQSASQYNSSGTYSPAKTAAGRKRRRASARADLRKSRKRQQRARRTRESSSVADSTVARTSAAFKPSKAPKPPKAAKNWTASQAANWVTGKKPGKPKYQERVDRLQTRIDRTNKQIEKLDSRTRYVPPAARNTSTVPGVPTGPGGPSGPTVRPGISARQAQANTKRRGNLEKRKDSLVAQRNKLRSLRETVGNQPRKAPKFGATPITKDAKRTQRGAELYTQVKLGQPLRARDFIGRSNIANRVLIQKSKQSWAKAAKDGLPVALGPQNPWRQSRKLAKPNETAAEKFERETEVLNKIMASDNVSPSDDKNVASSALLSAQIKQQAQDAEAAGIDDALVGPAIRGGITSSKAKVERIINADSFGQAVQELSTREMYDPNGDGQSTNAEMLEGFAGAALELTKVKAVTGFGRWGNGIIGRTVAKVRGGRAAGTPLGIRGTAATVQTEALSTMAPGRAFLNFVKKHPQWAKAPRRVGYGAIGTSAVTNVGGTRDMGLAFLEGTTTADFWKAAPTTLRNVVGMITAPAAIAVNVGVTANRAVDAIGEENDYKRSQEYITAPAQRLAEETWYELQRTVDIMTSKDAERIREATEDDYGYIMAMSGAWLLRTTGKLAVEDSRLAAQYMAKKIANTPAGRAAAKAMWENEWSRGKIENAQLRSKQRKTKKEEKKVSRNTYIAGGRIEGKAGSTTAIMDSRITKPKQKFLSWDRKKSRRNPAYKSVESRIDAFNNRNMAKLKEDDVASDAIQLESVEGIAIYMDSKGMVPGVTTIGEVRATRNNTPEKGGPEYRRLTLMLELTDLWAKPGSTGFKLFNKMWEEAGNNRKDAEAIRQSRQAQSEAGRRQMESDLEVQRQETLVTAARIEGEDIPLSPRDEQEQVLDAERTQRLDKAKFEYELAEKTVDRLFKEYGRTKAELRVLVREREEEIAMAVRGTPTEDQLRSASERVFKVVVNEKYAEIKLADVISDLKDARGRKDAPEVKRLTELKKKVQQERREAADAKQELRRLEKVAEKMAGKPSARLRKLYAKRQRIQGRLGPELDTAKERRIVLRILKEEEWGQLTAEERLAELLMMEPVQKAAMLELKHHSEALSLLENERAGVDKQEKLNEAALLMLKKPGGKKRVSLDDLENEIEELAQDIKIAEQRIGIDEPGKRIWQEGDGLPTTAKAVNNMVWYHASGTDGLSAEDVDMGETSPESQRGQGFYASADLSRVEDVQTRLSNGMVYEFQVDVEKVLNLNGPITDELLVAARSLGPKLSIKKRRQWVAIVDELAEEHQDHVDAFLYYLSGQAQRFGHADANQINEALSQHYDALVGYGKAGPRWPRFSSAPELVMLAKPTGRPGQRVKSMRRVSQAEQAERLENLSRNLREENIADLEESLKDEIEYQAVRGTSDEELDSIREAIEKEKQAQQNDIRQARAAGEPDTETNLADDPIILEAKAELEQLIALRDFVESWDAAEMPRQKLIRAINGEQQRLGSEQTRLHHAITVQRAKVAVAMSRKGSEETREEFLTNTIADATQEKLSAQRRAELAVLRDRQEQNVAAAIERNNIVLANYVPHVTETANRISSAMPETYDINSRNDQRRQGELQERGLATRSAEDADAANRRVIEEQKNHDIAMHIASQGILTVDVPQPDGTVVTRSVFHPKELEEGPIPDLFQQQYGYPINDLGYGAPRSGLDAADRMGGILALGGKSTPYRVAVGDEKDDFTTELKDLKNDPKYQETGDNPGHVVSDPVIDGDSFRNFDALSDEFLDESEAGTPIVLIRKPMLDLFRQQDKDLEGVAAALYRLNRVSTRMVLGYSFAWMFSQVIAEMLLLVVEHPTRAVPALLKARKFQLEGGMAAQQLARLAGSTPGPNPAASSRTRPTAREQQRAVREAARHQQTSPVYLLGGVLPTIKQKAAGWFDVATETVPSRERSSKQQLAADIAWGRQFGRFDRWKSAWIREAGVLANIDKDLSNMARAAKAVRGQVDLIETHADKLSKMTDEEVLLWTDSKEGYEVGMELMKQIDDQMGNWMDLRPGLESAVGQIIFFYPYIRFSLKWAFHTFPKNHPVLYALATTMGAANAEMLERIVNYDPAWPNEWAVVPVFGTPGNAPDYDPTDPEAGELMQNQGSAPTSFWSVSRFNSAGNAATETIMGGQTTDPLYAAVGTITPLASTVIRSAFAIDPYGNKLSDANDAFNESSPSGGARAGQAIDEVLGLIAPTREMQKQSGYSFKDILDGNISLDGAARILKQFENGNLPRRFDDRVGREGGAIEILRSLFIPGLPEDAQVTIDEQKVAKLEGDVREARAAQGGTYNFKGKTRVPSVIPGDKGTMKFLDAAGLVIGARRRSNKEDGMNVAARTPYETAIARAYIKQKNEKAEAQAKLEAAQLQLKHFLTDRGYPIDPQSSLGKELFDQKSADKVRAYNDWPEDAPWPGFNKAKRYMAGIEARGSATGRPGVNAPTASPELTNVTITPGRRKVTTNLRSGTEQRLLAMAKKQGAGNPQAVVNQLGWRSDPTLDPETKVNKKGEVVNYRGAKVLGNMTIDELAKAEQGNDLTRDGDGRILAPRARKLVAAVENASAKVADLRQDVVRQRSKMGGAPALVPQEYKAAIKKWGAWLDKRPDMKSPNDDMVDGLIPKSMSGAEYLAKIIQHESGWNADAYNDTAGATGMGQFIPSTRQGMIDQYGVDPWASGNDAIHAAALYLSEGGGGLFNYNSAYPNSGDNQGTPGTWDGYLNEDVGPMRGNNPKVEAKVKALQQQLQGLSAQQKQAVEAAEKAGIPLDLSIYDENTVRQLDEPTLWKQPTERPKNKPKLEDTPGMAPLWEGTSKEILRLGYTISKWIGEPIGVNSLHRPGDAGSDHGSGNGLDIHAMAQREGGSAADEKRGDRIAAAAVRASGGTEEQVAELFANGNVTVNSPNGYRVQVLWKTDLDGNHFNHVHVGIAAEGEVKRVFSETGLELPYQPSTSSASYSGGGGSASVSSGGGGMSFGSGSGNPLGFGQGTAATWRDQSLLPPPTSGGGQSYEEGGVDSVVEQIAAASENNPDEPGVKSVAEQVAALPTVRKKKKAPRFPSNPI